MTMDVENLFRRYGPLVIRRCRKLLKDEQEALDVSQEVFVRLLRNREDTSIHNPSGLLYRMATNLSLNRIRDRRRKPTTNDEEFLFTLASLEQPEARMDARFLLSYIFGKHHDSTRIIAVLHYVDGLTLEEVSRAVGMSVPGVRKRLKALRKTLSEVQRP